jgi:YD repeat-containing protein
MATLEEMLSSGLIEPVQRDPDTATARLEESERHLRSAAAIAEEDPNGAYQLAYDGARKAVASHMARNGLRARRGEGAHAITAQYAEAAISRELGVRRERMRRRRNRSEYASAHFEEDEVADAIDIGRQIVELAVS